ncbi:winged helix-turn-helix domain-containing protein [Verrucomicrobiota bacterium]
MKTQLKEFRKGLAERTLEFLWRQWDALGVAGTTPPETRRVIDPEALLLATATIARWDPRLFDEVLDWLLRNGRYINGIRLKRMLKHYGFVGQRVLAVASAMLKKKDRRRNWRIVSPQEAPEEALFFLSDGRPMAGWGPTDPTFAQYGFLRGRLELRGYSRSFTTNPSCIWLRLRALFGASSRAEFILYLLLNAEGYPSDIARKTGYTQKSGQDTMAEMAASGFLHQTRKGREILYRLASPLWTQLAFDKKSAPAWILWPPLFRALEMIWLRLYDQGVYELSDMGLTTELFALMQKVRPLAEEAGIGHCLSPAGQGMGDDYLSVFMADVENLLDYMTANE